MLGHWKGPFYDNVASFHLIIHVFIDLDKREKPILFVDKLLYLFIYFLSHWSNTTRAKRCACRASFASTLIGADRAENVKLQSLCEWVQTGLLHQLSNQEWVRVN